MLGTNILGHDRDITNLHTHGLHVSPMGNSDNVMLMLMSGESFDYEYDLSKQEPGTLNFYHPHIHGSVAEQYWGGLAGALIVEDDLPVLSGYETHLMILKDITLSGADPEPYTSTMDYMHGKEGNTVMVNGQVNPVLSIRPGQVQRWRILNASNARFYKLSLEGHALYVVGTEGGLLDKPYPQSPILLSPGERVDVLVKASQKPGTYRLLSLPYSRGGGSMGQQVTLLTLSYKGSRTSDAVPSVIDPEAVPGPGDAHGDAIARAEHGAGEGVHQRDLLRGHGQHVRDPLDARDVGGLGDREPEQHGPPVPPARERLPGAFDQRGGRRLRVALHERSGVEGRRHRPEDGKRDDPGPGHGLRRAWPCSTATSSSTRTSA